jgi:subtilase family serine protease
MRISSVLVIALCLLVLGACGKKKEKIGVDLSIAGAPTYAPPVPTSDDTVTVTFQVVNSGTKAVANVPWTASFEDHALATGTIASLDAGATSAAQSFTMHGLEGGAHTLSVIVDPANAIAEDNDGNNAANVVVTFVAVPPKLDLDFSSMPTGSPASPTTSDARIAFSIRNEDTSGTDTIARNVHWHIYENGVSLGSNTIATINADGHQDQSFDLVGTAGGTPGVHVFTIAIDPHHAIVESEESEASNSATVTVTIMQAVGG